MEGRAIPTPPLIKVDGEDQAEIEQIFDSRMYYGKLQYLVKWLGYPITDNEWLPAQDMGAAGEYIEEFHEKYPAKPSPQNFHREKRLRKTRKRGDFSR